jgi:PAS domain S-box-containing protein
VWVDMNIASVRDSAGTVTHFVAHVIDISQRKEAEQMLSRSEQTLRRLVEGFKEEYFFYGHRPDGQFTYVSPSIASVLGYSPEEFMTHYREYLTAGVLDENATPHAGLLPKGDRQSLHMLEIRHRDGSPRWLEISEVPILDGGKEVRVEGIAHDITHRRVVEIELSQARKLEAVGQLAAGIAHEINTPIQYVGDSINFLKDAFDGLGQLIPRYRETIRGIEECGREVAMAELRQLEEDLDLEYVLANVDGAFTRCFDGIARVSGIVRVMKDFAHPDEHEKSPADINRALEGTLTIARNEYKYVADVELALGDIPPVVCHAGEMNQVFLNLIVNAGHAISDVVGESGDRGVIRVSTRREGASVCIEIADTGSGIPESIRERVFEPFFTTKAVGKGSGQGLAIARSIVVDKHHGALTFETATGRGTIFRVRLPIERDPASP